ncbi:MAG: threonine aldolase [Planctomycetota bacterium]|jgi:threonine aldolase
MRAAMAAAEVGDDVLDGDPTVRRLQEVGAAWLGKEACLYVPSGSMANQIAIGVWAKGGDELIALRDAHVLLYESGAVGALHGLQSVTLDGVRGAMNLDELKQSIRPDYVHMPTTAMICVEQTHMSSGGTVVPLEVLEQIKAVGTEHELPVHMDGARLANAVVASGISASAFAACADSVSVCLSKGLGAPVGSLIAGDQAFIDQAMVIRKRLGGWMRQAGIIAAAGLMALENGIERLSEDHDLARGVAEIFDKRPGLSSPVHQIETNLAIVRLESLKIRGQSTDAPGLATLLGDHGVGVMALGPDILRFVCHRDVGPADLTRLSDALDVILGA